MKTKLTLISLGAGAVLLAIASIHASWGQQGGYGSYGDAGAGDESGANAAMGYGEDMYDEGGMYGGMSGGGGHILNSIRAQIFTKVKELRAAGTDKSKDEAKKETQTLLDRYFEADMKERQREVAAIEERVKRLRAQLEKRQAAKDEIVQLQLKVIVNEAEGLGFFTAPSSGSMGSGMGEMGAEGMGMGSGGMGGGMGGGFF